MNQNKLLQRHSRIFEQHQCEISEADYKGINLRLDLLLQTSTYQNNIYTICDFNRRCFKNISPKLKQLVGNSVKLEWQPVNHQGFYSLIHPDDLDFVLDTEIKTYAYLHKLPHDKKKEYKLVYDFRVKNAKEGYSRLINQLMPLEYDKQGNAWMVLIVSNVLSYRASNEKPRRYLVNIKTHELSLFKNDICKNTSKLLTLREKEILLLISQGLDSQAISENLNISVNTVNNHRQNILRKTQTYNMAHALNIVRNLGGI